MSTESEHIALANRDQATLEYLLLDAAEMLRMDSGCRFL